MKRPRGWIAGLVIFAAVAGAALAALPRAFPFAHSGEPIRGCAAAVVGEPRAVFDSTKHVFDVMDVGQTAEHWFSIANEGTADLQLSLGPTTCSCTLSNLSQGKVPPGGKARARLQWTPPKAAELFVQGVTISTNDPRQRSIYLSVVGAVRSQLAASAESIVFTDVHAGSRAMQRLVVYSQRWEAFELEAVCKHPNVKVEIESANEDLLSQWQAKSAYVVRVSLLPGLKPGLFQCEVKLLSRTADAEAEPHTLTIPIAGQVAHNIWLEGANLVESNLLDFGTVPLGSGKSRHLTLFVCGGQQGLAITNIQPRPEFLKIEVGAQERVTDNLSRYSIQVEIPPDAPETVCVGEKAGEIVLRTDHPDAPVLRMKVDFAILAAPREGN